MSAKDHYSNAMLAIFLALVVTTLVYLFYTSALRERVENKLFDIRTRLAPTLMPADDVVVVAIDQPSIDTLEAAAPQPSDGRPKDLSYASLLRVVRQTLNSKARQVAVLLPPQVFSYDDPMLGQLVNIAANDSRMMLGTFDQSIKGGWERLPKPLQTAKDRVFKADITRSFRKDVIRDLLIYETDELPYLTAQIVANEHPNVVDSLRPTMTDGGIRIRLSYGSTAAIPTISAKDVADGPPAERLNGKIALVGYTAYRPYNFRDREATYANTPWQSEGDDLKDGVPVVTLDTIGIVNLLNDAWLKPATRLPNVLQTAIIAIATLLSWRLSIGFASFLFIGGWSMILIVHALIFAFFRVDIPLADAFLWSALTAIIGALGRLRSEGRARARQEAEFQAEKELAEVQGEFLSRFAAELATINGKVGSILASVGRNGNFTGAGHAVYGRAVGSCEELEDYLAGIRQFTELQQRIPGSVPGTRVDVNQVVLSVLNQFDARKREGRLHFELTLEDGCEAQSDRTLLTQILYNLVSNAVKYSPPDSTIAIRSVTRQQRVVISVKDQGPGIASEFHERIFEKFYRVKDDFVYKHKGHGLGLYLSRYFARQIGAAITVSSEPGQGAEFFLDLPRAAT